MLDKDGYKEGHRLLITIVSGPVKPIEVCDGRMNAGNLKLTKILMHIATYQVPGRQELWNFISQYEIDQANGLVHDEDRNLMNGGIDCDNGSCSITIQLNSDSIDSVHCHDDGSQLKLMNGHTVGDDAHVGDITLVNKTIDAAYPNCQHGKSITKAQRQDWSITESLITAGNALITAGNIL